MRLSALVLLLVTQLVVFGQADTLPSNKDIARLYITQLKNGGALVVRLKSQDKAIAAYRNSGNGKIADEIIERNNKLNREVMDAFKAQFRFCPVYFMYSRHSKDFVDGTKRNVLVNDKLQEDSTIAFNHSFFLFAEYGTLMSNQSVNPYTSTSQTQESGSPASNSAYVVLDNNFKQLQSPFPYYTILNFLEQEQHQKAVGRLNKKFFEFFVDDKEKQVKEEVKKKEKAKKKAAKAKK